MTSKYLCLFSLLLCCAHAFAQSEKTGKADEAVVTLPEVSIVGKKINHPHVFSTFTQSPFRIISRSIKCINYYGQNFANLGLCVKVNNAHNQKIRVDSLYIKTNLRDISRAVLYFQVYQNGKIYQSVKPRYVTVKGKVDCFVFSEGLYFPDSISYFAFTFKMKKDLTLKIYTNPKVQGYCYSYNKEHDVFKLLDKDNKDWPCPCPQIKLFYTLVPEN